MVTRWGKNSAADICLPEGQATPPTLRRSVANSKSLLIPRQLECCVSHMMGTQPSCTREKRCVLRAPPAQEMIVRGTSSISIILWYGGTGLLQANAADSRSDPPTGGDPGGVIKWSARLFLKMRQKLKRLLYRSHRNLTRCSAE